MSLSRKRALGQCAVIHLWDVATLEPIHTTWAHTYYTPYIEHRFFTRWVDFAGSYDTYIGFWDTTTDKKQRPLDGCAGGSHLPFPLNPQLVPGTNHGIVHLWSKAQDQETLKGHTNGHLFQDDVIIPGGLRISRVGQVPMHLCSRQSAAASV